MVIFKPQAFDRKKLHPENEPDVWSELHRYARSGEFVRCVCDNALSWRSTFFFPNDRNKVIFDQIVKGISQLLNI